MHITANFDAGNIEVINLEDKKNIQLAIRPDVGGEFFQWFNFRLTGEVGEQYVLNIMNAGDAAFPAGWGELPSGGVVRSRLLVSSANFL